jgi:flagellar hook protein FlgE
MTLNSALNAAVSGLQAQSNALSVISTNIANASTTGYTTEDTSFDSLVSGSTGAQNNNSDYGGSGVQVITSYDMQTIGQDATTGISTNIALSSSSSNGFFVVSPNTTNTSSTTDLYSRDGSFSQADGGYLKNSSGDYLMGYATDADGTATSSSVGQLSALTPVYVPPTVSAVATTSATLVANLPAGLDTATENLSDSSDTDSTTSSLDFIDSLGTEQSVSETWTNLGDNKWILQLGDPTDASGATTGTTSPNAFELTFNSDGTLDTIYAGSVVAATGSTAESFTTSGDALTNNAISLTIAGTTSGVDSSGDPVTTDLSNGAAAQTISLDLSGMTQQAATNSASGISVTSQTNDGSLGGLLSSISISTAGIVSAVYSNSSNTSATTTVDVAQIPLATFADEEGLTAISGSTFAVSSTSGAPTLVAAGTDGTGALSGGSLNSSTTDTSTQFDSMIVAEQAYSAAAQIVTYDTKMFDTLIQSVSA